MIKSPDTYQGKQIILTSDRLIFNAREDQVYSSDSTIAFSTNKDFHINTTDGADGKFVVNSPKIHLGLIKDDNKLANNPALKGDETQQLLEDILNHLNLLYSSVLPLLNQITVFPGLPTVPSPTNVGLISPLISDLESLRGKINNIKSTNVYLK